MYYSVVANRRQPNLYTRYIVGGGGGVRLFDRSIIPREQAKFYTPLAQLQRRAASED